MSAAQTGAKPYYFVPQPSYWPLVGVVALLLHGHGRRVLDERRRRRARGWWRPASRVLLVMLFGWFGTVIGESEARLYNKKVDARSAGA